MAWTSPVSALCVMLLFGNHVEAMIVPQSVPNGVSQNLAGVLINELQLAAKGAAVPQIGELLQHCIFKLMKYVIFLQVDCKLDFLSSKGGQHEAQYQGSFLAPLRTAQRHSICKRRRGQPLLPKDSA